MKILFLDIETSPIIADVWKLWDNNVGLNQIAADWYILSWAAGWLGTDKVQYADQRHAKNLEDDSEILAKLWTLLDEADVVVAHNGDRFDVPKINARFIKAGLPPPAPYRTIDTLKIAKGKFKFTSNRLAYLATFLDVPTKKQEHSEFPGHSLWVEVRKGNLKAWRVMKEYNVADVEALKHVYLKLAPWAGAHPNLGIDSLGTEPVCPVCGSAHLSPRGFQYSNTGKFQRFVCECGAWSRDKTNLLTKEKRKSLLAK